MRRLAAVVIAFSVLCSLSSAQSGFRLKTRSAAELFADQRRAVGTWCRQDFEGLRLSQTGWERFKPVTALKGNPDFNSIVIVSRFQFEPRESSSWEVAVSFAVIGRYERGSGYLADPGSQTVIFQTKDIDGEVIVTNVDPASPHVSKKVAVDWMKKELETTTSDVEKIHLREALKQLDAPTANAESSK